MAKHRRPSRTKQNIKRATTVTLGGVAGVAVTTAGMPTVAYAAPVQEPTAEIPVAAPVAEAPATTTTTIPGGDRVVAKAREYFGVKYVWGGEGRSGMDCSGLVQRVFADLGVDLPRTSRAQASAGVGVNSLAEARPGDLLLFDSDRDGVINHVAIYVSPGRMIDSATYGTVVQERDIWMTPTVIRHVSVGDEEVVTPAAEQSTNTYTVVEGDWLSTIAPRVGMTTEELYAANQDVIGTNPNLIFPGQVYFVGGLPLAQAPMQVNEGEVINGHAHPAPGTRLTSGMERAGHNGIDLAAPIGTPIYAAASGVVNVAGYRDPGGFGAVVYMTADNGDVLWYGHIDTWLVSAGQRVQAGQQIATIGNRGNSTGPHLHFEVHDPYLGPINPITWLENRGIAV